MPKISTKVDVKINVTPETIAIMFTELTDSEQREFFEEMAKLWKGLDFRWQVWAIKNRGKISVQALEIMNQFGANDD